MGRVLVADDNRKLLSGLQVGLRRAGHEVACVSESTGVLFEMAAFAPDVILLDIMMPGVDGWQVCRAVRQVSQVPIIFLTALRAPQDVVDGLEMGGDDYITKPFAIDEVIARIEAVLRRSDLASRNRPTQTTFDDGVLCIDLVAETIHKRGRRVLLKGRLFDLLEFLLTNAGKIMTHEQILRAVWGHGNGLGSTHVATYISYLRRRIEDDPSQPRYVRTRFGLGYYFCTGQEA